jgi:hypothetical protein
VVGIVKIPKGEAGQCLDFSLALILLYLEIIYHPNPGIASPIKAPGSHDPRMLSMELEVLWLKHRLAVYLEKLRLVEERTAATSAPG